MKNILLFSLSLIIIIGCSDNNSMETFSKFPKRIKLEGKETGVELYFKIAYLDVYDSLLLITETHTENTIHLHKKNSFDYIFSTGKIGRGPGEIERPGFYVFDKEKGILWTPDLADNEIMKWKIDSLIAKVKTYRPTVSYKPPSCLWPTPSFSQLNDSTFLYRVQDNPDYYFYAANTKGKVTDSLNIKNKTKIYPDVNKKDLIATRWFHHIIHPTEKKILIAYRNSDIIVGIDFNGNILFQKQGPDMIQESPTKNYMKRTYSSLRATKSHILGLYKGGYVKKYPKDKPKYPENIFVFDWQGKPIANLQLEHPTATFDIDKENKKIITYAVDLGQIVTYDLPSLLDESSNKDNN